jgi:hypothetical protein
MRRGMDFGVKRSSPRASSIESLRFDRLEHFSFNKLVVVILEQRQTM